MHSTAIPKFQLDVVDRLCKAAGEFFGGKIDTNALEFKTIANSAVYYLPQDLAVAGTAIVATDRAHRKMNPKHHWASQQQGLAQFLSMKQLSSDEVKITKKRGTVVVNLI